MQQIICVASIVANEDAVHAVLGNRLVLSIIRIDVGALT